MSVREGPSDLRKANLFYKEMYLLCHSASFKYIYHSFNISLSFSILG